MNINNELLDSQIMVNNIVENILELSKKIPVKDCKENEVYEQLIAINKLIEGANDDLESLLEYIEGEDVSC